jgi:hypothetical protein
VETNETKSNIACAHPSETKKKKLNKIEKKTSRYEGACNAHTHLCD